MTYNRQAACDYANKWALARNPQYYNFDPLGGDCTNFVSQCLFAGSGRMNYGENGWYYHSLKRRAPAWTGVQPLCTFLTSNHGAGPYGILLPLSQAQAGDIVQLSFDGTRYGHSLLIVGVEGDNLFAATHTMDSYNRHLSSWSYQTCRLIHIQGVR